MSSPNCCGCLALILSGLKANNINFNPFGVKRAIENSALQVDEILGSGSGLIQVNNSIKILVVKYILTRQKFSNEKKRLKKPTTI